MDFVSNYKKDQTRKAADDDDYVSDADSTLRSQISDQEVPDYAELMGADEVQTKGDPKRGRRYFFFNLIMIIALSLYVMLFSDWQQPMDTTANTPQTPQNNQPENNNKQANDDK